MLRDGAGLAAVTARLAAGMGVGVRVLPMTEAEVSTTVSTGDGCELSYQEFLVRHGAAPTVVAVRHDGMSGARPAPGVIEAIRAADVVIIGPSSPCASVDPILGLSGVWEAIRSCAADVVAVTPIVTRVPVAGTGEERRAAARAALLAAEGVPATATAIAARYRDIGARFVLDTADAVEASEILAAGVPVRVAAPLLHRGAPAAPLLDAVLARQRDRVDVGTERARFPPGRGTVSEFKGRDARVSSRSVSE